MQSKRILVKAFQYLWESNFFKHPVYPYELKENLIIRLKFNNSEKVILCRRDTVVA